MPSTPVDDPDLTSRTSQSNGGAGHQAVAIVNPWAGGGRCGRRCDEVLERIRNATSGSVPSRTVVGDRTSAPGEATDLARSAFARGVREFYVLGGDGTIFEVLQAILPAAIEDDQRIRLAAFPLGTGNSLIAHFGSDSEGVLQALRLDRRRTIDALELTHESGQLYALSTISLGITTDVTRTVNRYLKPLRAAAYHVGALFELLRMKNLRVSCAVEFQGARSRIDQKAPLLVFQNTSTFGKDMKIAPSAVIDDGKGEIVWADELSRWQLFRLLPKLYDGSHIGSPGVHQRKFDQVLFEETLRTRHPVNVDGEVLELKVESLKVLPQALELYI